VLLAHPSPDLYGSDLQLLESVHGLQADGWTVIVCLPVDGPLVNRLRGAGATVRIVEFPVLRRSVLRPVALLGLLLRLPASIWRMNRLIRPVQAVYVNTVTIPWWLLAARLSRRPVLIHVHEAEQADSRLLRLVLYAPARLAQSVVVNSQASAEVVTRTVPALRKRLTVVLNGVAETPPSGNASEPGLIALVTRLSPRKGVDVALEAVGQLRTQGRDVRLEVCGSAYPGYEWFEQQLRERAARPDLLGAVTFAGYVSPTRPVLDRAQVVIAPSLGESFGNTAVEAMFAARPLIASDVQGLAEIVDDGRTGLLFAPGDAGGLVAAVVRVLDSPELARELGDAGLAEARLRFGVERYRREIGDATTALLP
jgi:glycosyltransferase involved in cell wall biosynthesis